MDSKEFNGTFWLSLVGILVGLVSGGLVYAIKSKCSKCSMCYGLISIERNVEIEEKFEELELEKGISPFSKEEFKN
jgi:hypothetical protein